MRAPRVRILRVQEGQRHGIDGCPNFHRSGSITGMRRMFYGYGALLVRCGRWIYNVTDRPELYDRAR